MNTCRASGWWLHTGISVKRATKALEVKHITETTANPATCTEKNKKALKIAGWWDFKITGTSLYTYISTSTNS